MRPLVALLLTLLISSATTGTTRYTLPHLVTTYRDGENRMIVEIAYAIPRAGIAASGGKRDGVKIEQTLTAVDTLGNKYHESWARPTSLKQAGHGNIRSNYVLSQDQLLLPTEAFDVFVGVQDLKVNSTGSFHVRCQPPGSGQRFDVSELLLATDIQSPEEPPITRHTLAIKPNPLRLYLRDENIFVFLELYNLKRDVFGQTNFELAYRMDRPSETEMPLDLFESLDKTDTKDTSRDGQTYLVPTKHRSGIRVEKTWEGKERETTIATRYVGDSSHDLTFLEFDVSQLPAGVHQLTIIATDSHTSSTVDKAVVFRILDP
jgi:hypothetical protein